MVVLDLWAFPSPLPTLAFALLFFLVCIIPGRVLQKRAKKKPPDAYMETRKREKPHPALPLLMVALLFAAIFLIPMDVFIRNVLPGLIIGSFSFLMVSVLKILWAGYGRAWQQGKKGVGFLLACAALIAVTVFLAFRLTQFFSHALPV